MAQVSGTTDTNDIVGTAEDIEDIIFSISPTETPLLTMAKQKKASNTLHQWQTDSLSAAAANRQIEGDDASFTTATPTTMLSNYCQISRKTLILSDTSEAVRMYGRDSEEARLMVKYGKDIKRDIEYALVRNQASSAGGNSTARSSAGLESMIAGNRVLPSSSGTGTTPGYSGGVWSAPTDGTATGAGSTLTEAYLKSGIQAAWEDGGNASVLMCGFYQKTAISQFAGASKFAGSYTNQGRTAQGVVVGGVDLYISDVGEHRVVLNRYMRTSTLFGIDPDYVSVAKLRPLSKTPLAKTGDASKSMMVAEFTLVCDHPDAHFKVQDLYSA